MVVLALVAILSVVVILTLNPAELIKQARDSNRLSDLSTINTALNLFSADVTSGFMGTSTVVYVSLPDNSSSTCGSWGLPTLPSGYTYNCVTTANLRNTNGTGWIPVNFQRISSNSPISQLPIDPINTTTTRLYYTYVAGGSWELNATIEASKNKLGGSGDLVSKDGGNAASQYEIGNNLNLNPIEIGDTSLVGYWNFENNILDHSGNGNDISWRGTGTHYTNGKAGNYAGQFNGSDDYTMAESASNVSFGSSSFSLSAWFKTSNAGPSYNGWVFDTKMAGSLGVGYNVHLYNNCVVFGVGNGVDNAGGSGLITVTDGQWHHFAGVVNRSNGTIQIYTDGNLDLSKDIGISGSFANDYPFQIGAYKSPSGYFLGQIDDVRIYNRALSAAEISALYNSTK